MLLNTKLVSVGKYDLKLNHLIIIGVLALSVTISALLRSQASEYGFELNEFDPFFNYRASQYMVDNGIGAYYEWHDTLSWHPYGRDIAGTSQIMLHVTAVATYWVFGGGMDYYDFTIIFPVVFGSITAIFVFALVRVIGGTTAGLFAALLYSISLPILVRGTIGWFKSEPLGLFYAILAGYLLLSGLHTQNKKIAVAKLVGAGVTTAFAISAWGGNQFFIVVIGIFFLTLPFLRSDHKFIVWAIPLFTAVTLGVSAAFAQGISFSSFEGIALIGCTAFLVSCIFIQKKSGKNKTRNGLVFLCILLIIVPVALYANSESQFLSLPSYRYLNAINPFLTTINPLTDSVSEHATTTTQQSFLFNSILMIFAGIGAWLIIKNNQNKTPGFIKNDLLAFSLIIGMFGVYISSAFIRLEVFASVAVILLSSLGLTVLTREFFKNTAELKTPIGKVIKVSFVSGVVILLVGYMVLPVDADIFSVSKAPPTILNGGTSYQVATNDWLDTFTWIKNNTPKDAVIASWWDYGYWISTMGERASLADNYTGRQNVIENIARIFLNNPDDAWSMLQEAEADYILVFVAGQKIDVPATESLYILQGGGDESKKHWFIRIAGDDLSKYLHADGLSSTDHFWNETLLGQMFPFELLAYVNPNDISQQYPKYIPGTVALYGKEVKYPADGDGPLRLVYASSGYVEEKVGPMLGIFIYEVNKEYEPVS